jgi:uncharacterized Zn-finger protein
MSAAKTALPVPADWLDLALNPLPICPYCGAEHTSPLELDLEDGRDTEAECLQCGRTYGVTGHLEWSYTTRTADGAEPAAGPDDREDRS